MSTLFQTGSFRLANGQSSTHKVECDALSCNDWITLAYLASKILPPFGFVEGVPTGGLKFAKRLESHATPGCSTLLIADDVFTTGGSMERYRNGRNAIGIVAFSRGSPPEWIRAIWQLAKETT